MTRLPSRIVTVGKTLRNLSRICIEEFRQARTETGSCLVECRVRVDVPGACLSDSTENANGKGCAENLEIVIVHFVAKRSLANLIQTFKLVERNGEAIGHNEPMKEDGKSLLPKCLHLFRFTQNFCSGWN